MVTSATHPKLRTDATTRAAYISDAGIYRRYPEAVAEPSGIDEIRDLLALADRRGWPVVSRGAGTSVAGNAISTGIVIDHSRHHNRILDIDVERRTARVEPGVVCDQLRVAALKHGLTYGPDPSTHSRCTIGGMVANNACGSHSIAWGTSAGNLVSARLLRADGSEIAVGKGWCSDPLLEAGLRQLVTENEELIRAELGRFPRQVSGYGLHYLLPENGFDVAKAVAGSEGTLGIFTELTVALVEPPAATALAVIAFPDSVAAARAAAMMRRPGVLTIEGMGSDLIDALRTRPGQEEAGRVLPEGGAWLYCEVSGSDVEDAVRGAEELSAYAATLNPQTRHVVVIDADQTRELWRIREAGAGITTRRADGGEAWPGWEDSAVPAAALADYLRDLYALMADEGLVGIPFGHFGEGCLHMRLDFDLHTDAGIAAYRRFILAAGALAHRYGGSMSGEHGDGRARSELLDIMYSAQMRAVFARFKDLFDPGRRLNPGVVVDAEPFDEGLRPGPGSTRHNPTRATHALTADAGSFASAMNRCAGVGLCRDPGGGMCPSYQATKDEVHSTRGRARVLSEMLRGEHLDGWRSREALDALDLCLSCKACATECPVGVDMATYKAEFLSRHYRGRLRPRAHYVMGWLPKAAAMVTSMRLGRVLGAAMRIRPLERTALTLAGVESSRRMIPFASRSLRSRYADRAVSAGRERLARGHLGTVMLWPDTFTNHNTPQVGAAAIEVLEALGYDVVLPDRPACCGLTFHSTGQLGLAQRALRGSISALAPAVENGWPIVVLEPSCRVMLADATDLVPEAGPTAAAITSFAEVADRALARLETDDQPLPFRRLDTAAVAQIHCHQRAKEGYDADAAVLARVGVDVSTIRAGCCGLAGNWGFEPGHAEISRACAERELFPRIRREVEREGAMLLADGFSCRTQIAQGTSSQGLHLAEVLREALH